MCATPVAAWFQPVEPAVGAGWMLRTRFGNALTGLLLVVVLVLVLENGHKIEDEDDDENEDEPAADIFQTRSQGLRRAPCDGGMGPGRGCGARSFL